MGAIGDKRRIDVMVSSTYLDLVDYRAAVIKAAQHLLLPTNVMELNPVPNADTIDASMAMVEGSEIYVGLLGLRYGACPVFPDRNPDGLSLTELEYNRAKERNIPRLMFEFKPTGTFSMTADILNLIVAEGEIGRKKRETFKARVEQDRILQAFTSAEDLKTAAILALNKVKEVLEKTEQPASSSFTAPSEARPISTDLHPLNSPYIMQRDLVGRLDELNCIDTWAKQPSGGMLLFQAIGGMGKSALTWHWAKEHALSARPDLRGRLWYSFYEQGASLRDFLFHAVAHITGQAPEALRSKSSTELGLQLRHELDHEPWLLVLDGLERVLVAYNRPGKDYASDEEAEVGRDGLGLDRKARDCIRPEDDRVLAGLAQTQRSKVLASSRLLPTALTSDGLRPISGVTYIALEGLSPPDGAQLLIDAGVTTKDRGAMQAYLQATFACHPLSIQVIPGLMRKLILIGPLDFDAWVQHKKGGRDPGLLAENLRGRQNHILYVAFAALDDDEKALLASLSIMTVSLTRDVIELLNPNRLAKRAPRKTSEEADQWLWLALERLSDYGLVQYDATSGTLDLHPAVRHTALTRLTGDVRQQTGKRVADALTSRAVVPFDEVDSVAELQFPMDRVRALSAGGQWEAAANYYRSGLAVSLKRLGAWPEILELLQDWFPLGWRGTPVIGKNTKLCSYVLDDAAKALANIGQKTVNVELRERALRLDLDAGDIFDASAALSNLANAYESQQRNFTASRIHRLAFRLSEAGTSQENIAFTRLGLAHFMMDIGELEQARAYMAEAPAVSSKWVFASQYEARRAYSNLNLAWRNGRMDEAMAEATLGVIRRLKERRYELHVLDIVARWRQGSCAHTPAIDAFDKAIALARRMGLASVTNLEVGRASCLLFLGERDEATRVAAVAAIGPEPPYVALAELYLDLGNTAGARRHVLEGYDRAWADGPPYSHHWNLERCRKVLVALGEPEPVLPPFDAARHPPLPFEAEVEALIAKTVAEHET